jgi:hypothetical protein
MRTNVRLKNKLNKIPRDKIEMKKKLTKIN